MRLIPRRVQTGFEALLDPLVARLIARGTSPNAITSVGTLILVGGGVAYGLGQVRLGGAMLLASGVMDMLDGRVARQSDGVTKFGAFYDSTLDRIGESALYTGIGIYFVRGGAPPAWSIWALLVTLVALSASLTVSYARARAEGLDLECKVGLAQRAERILGLGLPSVFFAAGPDGLILLGVVTVLAALAVITVVQRIMHVRRITRVKRRDTKPRWGGVPMVADSSRKGHGGD